MTDGVHQAMVRGMQPHQEETTTEKRLATWVFQKVDYVGIKFIRHGLNFFINHREVIPTKQSIYFAIVLTSDGKPKIYVWVTIWKAI